MEIFIKSNKRIIRLVTAAAPIFAAYVIIGTSLFGARTYRFSTLSETSVTLFAVLNGDAMRETWNQVKHDLMNRIYVIYVEINYFQFKNFLFWCRVYYEYTGPGVS